MNEPRSRASRVRSATLRLAALAVAGSLFAVGDAAALAPHVGIAPEAAQPAPPPPVHHPIHPDAPPVLTTDDHPRALVLGLFVAVNLLILTGAAIVRARGRPRRRSGRMSGAHG